MEPRTDPDDLRGHLKEDAAAARTPEPERLASPIVVVRGAIRWRLPALVIPVMAASVFVLGRQWGIALVVFAVPFVPAFWIRIEMSDQRIRRRDWRRRWTTVELDPIDTFRLRRVPFAALAWLPRGYRVGRFWSVPLTLRLLHQDAVRLELRCAWWDGWREIARYVAQKPGIDLDARTRGRLGRYVWPVAFTPPAQP